MHFFFVLNLVTNRRQKTEMFCLFEKQLIDYLFLKNDVNFKDLLERADLAFLTT